MQIVIDIAQNEYDALEKLNAEYLLHIIKDGTPLPKGHGRLIDANALLTVINQFDYYDNVREAETIIEEDKEDNKERLD